jgi:hypothetical protein
VVLWCSVMRVFISRRITPRELSSVFHKGTY